MHLREMAMLKDNHLRVVNDLKTAIAALKKKKPGIQVELECQTLDDLRRALDAGADIIMLDNMTIPVMKQAISMVSAMQKKSKKPRLEISGGVNLKTVRKFAELGVDMISIGALTHSAPALDISLEIVRM